MAMIHKAITLKRNIGQGYRVVTARNVQSFTPQGGETIDLMPGFVVTSKEAEALIAGGIDVTFR